MALDLDRTITTSLSNRPCLESIEEARRVYRALGALSFEDAEAAARRLQLDASVVRGLATVSRHACMALEWLEYHGKPLTKRHLQQLQQEFERSDPKQSVLGWELQVGAWEVLRKVDWQRAAGS